VSRAILGLDPGMDGAAVLLRRGESLSITGPSYRPGFAGISDPVLFRDYTIPAPSRGKQWDHGRLYTAFFVIHTKLPIDEPITVVLESPRAQPGAASSSLSIGVSYGILLGMIAALGWELVRVQPSVWHRALFGKNAAGDPKARAAAYVRDRLPQLDTTCMGRFKKPHGGVIDAACLALYGREKGTEPK
jgi:hypothetical protein